MKVFFGILALVGSLLVPSMVYANKIEYKIHVIYAGDQSASMRFSNHPSWMSAQQYFLTEYFKNYQSRCQELHFDYVAWGVEALPPLRVVLRTNADGKALSDALYQLTYQNEKATVQHKAILQALSLVTKGYDRTLIVFVSDANIGGEKDAELWKLVPADVEFVGISLGNSTVADYFDWHIVPPTVNGKHFHAYTTPEFEKILYDLFDGLGFDHCPST